MDATISNGENTASFTLCECRDQFKGQFCSVLQFLAVLDGSYSIDTGSIVDIEMEREGEDIDMECEENDTSGPKLLTVEVEEWGGVGAAKTPRAALS
ncbi:hypothetical protein F441_08287 [Phytophthora nicotianae CJ01A1]|uniref:Uncharacterized protein n=1 Tax=Phytophthora nicotianae CJ01A1 TaxID=1317063 RepID=W2X3G3_PHYNI|nr:hypothetical protein F441_08287 [Phytophthora nicotianae CJ01A1]